MPLYEYKCPVCSTRTEAIRPYTRRDASPLCPGCRSCDQRMTRLVSTPAFTPCSWGDTRWDGLHDRGLNVKLRDRNHRDAIMKKRGLREVQDGEVEAEISRVTSEQAEHDRNIQTYQRVLKDTGSSSIAMAQTFPNPEI